MSISFDATGKIVVGTDLSGRAQGAVEWAADRAAARGVPLMIVLALPEVPIPKRSRLFDAMVTGDYRGYLEENARHKLVELSEQARAAYPDLVVETHIEQGLGSYVLAQASKKALLVVVGARGANAPVKVRALGGTADAVVAHAHGPVAVITDHGSPNPDGPVVVGVDDSPEAMAAVSFAVAEAVRRGTGLVAVHVWDSTLMLLGGAGLWSGDGTQISAALETMIDEVMRPYLDEHPDLQYRTLVLSGRAPNVLAEAAHEASVLVIGSRGRHGFAGQLLGSTSRDVLREAECPVVVVRT